MSMFLTRDCDCLVSVVWVPIDLNGFFCKKNVPAFPSQWPSLSSSLKACPRTSPGSVNMWGQLGRKLTDSTRSPSPGLALTQKAIRIYCTWKLESRRTCQERTLCCPQQWLMINKNLIVCPFYICLSSLHNDLVVWKGKILLDAILYEDTCLT